MTRPRHAILAAAVLEKLASRRLLSGVAMSVHHGVLVVRGTRGDDAIVISVDSAGSNTTRMMTVESAGKLVKFKASMITGVRVNGGAGNDDIEVSVGDGMHDVPVTLLGGRGDDTLVGGERGDVLRGDAGSDLIYGNGGDDRISGGRGDDSLIAGAGNDRVQGDAGNDLIGGGDGDDMILGGA